MQYCSVARRGLQIMSTLNVLFVVSIVLILRINVVESKTNKNIRELIFKLLQQNQGAQSHDDRETSSDSDSKSDSIDLSEFYRNEDFSRFEGSRDDIVDLIKKAISDKNKNRFDDELREKGKKGFEDDIPINSLKYLVAKVINNRKTDKNKINRLEPNTLLPFQLNDNRQDNFNGLENYSKIFIMLNPEAVSKGNSRNLLSNIIPKLLNEYSSDRKKDIKDKRNKARYKGFFINEDLQSRRARHDSNEVYAPKNSLEEDYKPKRARNDRGGGGAGRTAIPYIRHGRDIYEREN